MARSTGKIPSRPEIYRIRAPRAWAIVVPERARRAVMLALRPNCEYCDKDLPPAADDAMICSYECTFCRDCVETHLHNVCPNCGGGLVPRPIRPQRSWRSTTGLALDPPSAERRHLKYGKAEIAALAAQIRGIPPFER
jgi:hypothetical protein